MTRAQRNHNPGNLRFAGQKEATGKDKDGFAVFPNDPAGFRALVAQVKLDQNRGLNIEEFIKKYAPANENDTGAYRDYLCSIALEVSPSHSLSDLNPWALAGMISNYEGWTKK